MNFLANPIHTCMKSLPQSRRQTSENFPIPVEGCLSPLRIHSPTPVSPPTEALICFLSLQITMHYLVFHINGITVSSLLHTVSFPRHVFELHPCCCMPMVHPLPLVSSSIQGCVTVWLFIRSSLNHTASSLTHRSTGSLGTRRGTHRGHLYPALPLNFLYPRLGPRSSCPVQLTYFRWWRTHSLRGQSLPSLGSWAC